MNTRYAEKKCPQCGVMARIRNDRTFCSPTCARRFTAEAKREKLAIIGGDVHFPNHDPRAVDLFLRFIQRLKPDEVIVNGDGLDCYTISRWLQPGSIGPGMRAEVDLGQEFAQNIRQAAPKARCRWLEGNHEFRLRQFLNNEAAAVKDLDHGLTIPDQLEFDELGFEYVETPGSKWFSTYVELFPDLLVGHFNKTSINSAYAVKGLVERYGTSIITGHGHCMGVHHRKMPGREVTGLEGGCLCDLNPPYCEPHHWRQGFILAHHRPGEPTVFERVEIFNGAAYYGGKRFTA